MYRLNRRLFVNLSFFRCLMLMHNLRKAWLVLRWKQLQRWDLVKKVHFCYSLPLKLIKMYIFYICQCGTCCTQRLVTWSNPNSAQLHSHKLIQCFCNNKYNVSFPGTYWHSLVGKPSDPSNTKFLSNFSLAFVQCQLLYCYPCVLI